MTTDLGLFDAAATAEESATIDARYPGLIGSKFGRWTVLGVGRDRTGNLRVACRCECGTAKSVALRSLRSGCSRSCGCLFRELAKQRATTHGMKRLPEYGVWCSMKSRCENPGQESHRLYGARGISVAPEWRDSFAQFYADMGPRPSPGYSIERIDGNDDYRPGNCKWATAKEQSLNTSRNVRIEMGGRNLTVGEWAKEIGVCTRTILLRRKAGLPVEKILAPATPRSLRRKRPINLAGFGSRTSGLRTSLSSAG